MTPKALVFIVSAHTRDAFASSATIPPFAGELYQCLPKGMSWQPSTNPLLQVRFETLDSWWEKTHAGAYAPSTHIPILTTRTDITLLEPRYEGLGMDVLAGAFIPMGEWNFFLFYDLPSLHISGLQYQAHPTPPREAVPPEGPPPLGFLHPPR